MKKVLSLLLSVCLLCTILPAGVLTASAAESEPVVLFEDDFESYGDGAGITGKADTYGAWSSVVASTVSVIRAETVDATRGKAAHFYHVGTTSGGPRVHKTFYFENRPTNMTISYDARSYGCSLGFKVVYADGTEQILYSDGFGSWVNVRVELDFAAREYKVYTMDTFKKSDKLTSDNFSMLDFQFNVGVDPSRHGYLDNVKFTTTDNVDPEKCSDASVGVRTPEEIIAPFLGYGAAPALSVPTGAYSLFTYDGSLNANTGIMSGTEVTWSGTSRVGSAIIDGAPLIRYTNNKRVEMSGHLSKVLPIGMTPENVTVEYYTVLDQSKMDFRLRAGSVDLVDTSAAPFSSATAGVTPNAWSKVTINFNFKDSVYSYYINGTPVAENVAFAAAYPAGCYQVTFYLYARLNPAGTMLVDNFVMYQDTKATFGDVKYFGTTGTNWEKVTEKVVLTEDSYVNNLRQHPRLLINDRQAMIDKIKNNPKVNAWYTSYKDTADGYLKTEPEEYVFENGRNLKGVAGRIENRLVTLGFAYLIEGDEKYVERGLKEIRKIGTFPDWSNASPILSSGMMYGVACFYDWCYYSPLLTDAVKEEIIDIVKAKSLWQFVRSYENEISAEIANGNTNRTTVANACGAGMAIAMADEEPELAQLLIDGAIKCVKQTVEAYSPDGAFAEGTSYWNYANDSMYNFLAEMDNAVVDTYEKPEALEWYYTDTRLVNTPDYWAYMYGPGGNFDYGDSSSSFSGHPLIYWHSQRHDKPFYGWLLERTLQRLGSSVGSKESAINYYDPNYEYYNDGTMPLDKTFNASDLAQVASMRSSWTAKNALFGAIQGGDNAASHMSKSLGTFVIDVNGKRFIKQLGHVDYAALYDADLYYMERAEGNNTIIANPSTNIDQNPKAIARFIAHQEAENEAFTVLDMTETNDAFTDAKRGMYMTSGRRSIVLQDELTTNKPSEIWWFAHTAADVKLLNGGKDALLTIGDERMYVSITEGPQEAVFTVMEAEMLHPEIKAPDADAMQDIVGQKLAIHLSDVSELTLAVEFIPMQAGENFPTTFTAVQPIDAWSVADNTLTVNRQAGDAVVLYAGSPYAFAFEQKSRLHQTDAGVRPYIENGVYYVPARETTVLTYGTYTLMDEHFIAKRNYVENTVTEGIVMKDGTMYVDAKVLADALGMQLYTDKNGLIAFADRAVNYTEANKQAIMEDLGTIVYADGVLFDAFTTDKTVYDLPYTLKLPTINTERGLIVTRGENSASFALNGKTYTFKFAPQSDILATYNAAAGRIVTSATRLGDSNPPENMTDCNTSTGMAVKSESVKNVTLELELDGLHYLDKLVLMDYRYKQYSVMETVVYSGRLADGTWVEIGRNDNLDADWESGDRRTNTTMLEITEPMDAIRIELADTDGNYKERIRIYEFQAIGRKLPIMPTTPETYTYYGIGDNAIEFVTDLLSTPQSGILAVTLSKAGRNVATKLLSVAGNSQISGTFDKIDFDTIKVMLIESFYNMRILANPETYRR